MESESVKMKAPLIFCEILAYGLEKDKAVIKKMLDKLQRLLDKSKTNQKRVRVLWYIDNGEKTIDEKKEWLINESHCIFYVFTPEDHKVPDNFVSNLMIGVNMFDRAMKLMRKDGVIMKKNNAKENVQETQIEPPLEILD